MQTSSCVGDSVGRISAVWNQWVPTLETKLPGWSLDTWVELLVQPHPPDIWDQSMSAARMPTLLSWQRAAIINSKYQVHRLFSDWQSANRIADSKDVCTLLVETTDGVWYCYFPLLPFWTIAKYRLWVRLTKHSLRPNVSRSMHSC